MARILALLLLPISTFTWSQISLAASLKENVSVMLILSGDLTGQFDISGPLNQTLKTEAENENKNQCMVLTLFRKVKSNDRIVLEVWPTFECNLEGQKKTFKLHRSYLDLSKEQQKLTVRYLDQKVKNVGLEFRDLSIQRGK
jgi:hypothetical protein